MPRTPIPGQSSANPRPADVLAGPATITRERISAGLAATLAAPIGAVAVISPPASIATVVAVAFVATAMADLAAGVAVFATVTFFVLIPGLGASFVSVVKLAGAALLLSLGRKMGRRTLLHDHPLLASLAIALGTWAFASALWAPDLARARGRAFTLVLSLVLIFIVYGAIRKPQHVRWLVRGYVAGAVASALVGLVVPAPAEGDASRLSGGIGDPNELALVLVPGLVLAFFAIPSARGAFEHSLLVVSAGVMAVSLLETGSRGGLVALAVSFAAGLIVGGKQRARVFVALLGFTALGVAYFALAAPPEVSGRVLHFTAGGGSGRTDLWAIARQVAHDHPVLGVGIGNFEEVAPAYASRTTNLPAIDLVIDEPHVVHNSYLELLAELGVVGFALFVALVGAALGLGWRAVRAFARSGETDLELIARGLLIGLSGMLAASFFLSAEYEKQLWLLLGFATALMRVSAAAARRHQLSDGGPIVSDPAFPGAAGGH
jgi:O-antigen ligase